MENLLNKAIAMLIYEHIEDNNDLDVKECYIWHKDVGIYFAGPAEDKLTHEIRCKAIDETNYSVFIYSTENNFLVSNYMLMLNENKDQLYKTSLN